MTNTEPGHFLATIDYTTQTATTMCGKTSPLEEIPPAGTPFEPGRAACAECFSQVIQLNEKIGREAHNRLVEEVEGLSRALAAEHERRERGLTNLLDALESAEARLDALERKAKKGRRS